MAITAKLDEWGRPAWIAAVVLGFVVFWPVGLATLAYLYWSGRMTCSPRNGFGGADRMAGLKGFCGSFKRNAYFRPSGNTAFDEYRNEALKRLEEEEAEFRDFLAKLRAAKDKAEFDQFMSDRRGRSAPSTEVVHDQA
ncbi:DUF2852 domain-containing protein [Terrihabitans rhizophilus]|jgi:hypothetical protein|uniref:DUF2852 domain-containing protein n=1 Tax=Terrihabitans rhizophilus TaxID=3092662 RepID=A0ABU4RRB8_9HYPH|nr:DUF2852 domain-containing protein [Terrihabitans sp. PJ23]MDX6806728.1 DUF2852 domain-containing protein [Terrihabitans sp. PJ23]